MKKAIPQQQKLHRLQRLIELSRDLTSTLDLDTLLKRIVRVAVEMGEGQAASILLYDENTQQLFFKTATNLDKPQVQNITVPLEGSIAGWVVQNRAPVIISDAKKDPRFYADVDKTTLFTTSSMVAVPLVHKERVLGVLEVLNKSSGSFTADDQDIMMTLSAQAALAIENARLFQQSDLIAELVHEIRTPLASLNTASYLLQRHDLKEDQRGKLIQAISSETRRLNDLATSFLDLARLESGRVSFQQDTFPLFPLLEECWDVVRSSADEKQVTLQTNVPVDLLLVEADRDKMKQVLLNLLTNAIKYNVLGGFVRVEALSMPSECQIRVRDSGIGIPEEATQHLFDRFYRVKGSERLASGTGLGLSICKQIVEKHGGQIEVESQSGKGTVFTIRLPFR